MMSESGIMFGTISYLPDDKRVRSVRWKTTLKCLQNLIEVAGWVNKPLHIVTTNWSQEEKNRVFSLAESLRGSVLFHDVRMEHRGAAVSRNILLHGLYESDYDYLLMCDDDAHIYPYYDLKEFFKDLDAHSSTYTDLGVFHVCAHLANSAPFKEQNMRDKHFSSYWLFKAGGDHAGRCPQIFANYRKYLGKEIYQREYLYNELHLGGEDGCFDLDLMQEGVMAYTLTAFIAGTTEITSSFWDEKKSKQEMLKDTVWEEGQATLDYIKKEFPKVRQISKYRLDFKAYRPPHNPIIGIPRKVPYIPTEWDTPQKRGKNFTKGLLKR